MAAYDSDQESIDLNESPKLRLDNNDANVSSMEFCFEDLLDAECAQERKEEELEDINKELQLFSLDEITTSEAKDPDMETEKKSVNLQPPAVPFFTSKPCLLYSPDTLIWPEAKRSRDAIHDVSVERIHKKIREGHSQRMFLSKRKEIFLYHFHLMLFTSDYALMHCAFKSLMHFMDTASLSFNIFNDILLAVANLGADITQFGEEPSNLSSPVVGLLEADTSNSKNHQGTFRENKIFLLKFLSEHLERTTEYSTEELNILLKTVFLTGFDPMIMDSGNCIYIQNICHHLLSLYPSTEVFVREAMPEVVNYMISYLNFHHSVAYLTSNYIIPIQRRGQMLRSAFAILQAEIILQRSRKDLYLEDINVEDILDLINEQMEVFEKEQDSYLLNSLFMLFDTCISEEPLSADQRAKLQKLCDVIEPIMKKRNININFEDDDAQFLNHLVGQLLVKWRMKVGCTKRQQTLYELKGNFTPMPSIE